jgi:hypothetical protein
MNPLAPYLIWIKLAAGVAAAAVFGAGIWWTTATYYRLQIADGEKLQQAKIIIAQDEAAHRQAAADKITHDADVANAVAHQQIKTIPITQQVPVYVTRETDDRFPLPCGFVRLHNAYAGNTSPAAVPLPAGATDADKCAVTASAAVAIIGANYGLALGWKSDLEAWVKWYAEQVANWNKPDKGSAHG